MKFQTSFFSTVLLFVVLNVNVKAQSLIIEYRDIRNVSDRVYVDTGFVATLSYRDRKSCYSHQKLKKGEVYKRITPPSKEEIREMTSKNNGQIVLKTKPYEDSIGQFIYKNFAIDSLKARLFYTKSPSLRGDPKIHDEPLPKIDWKIEKEQKKIGNFMCQKATTRFRGRNYTAWFAPEIPISAGPWKLHGLSGLILEAYDDTKEIQFLFESIQYPAEVGEIEPKYENMGEKITFKDYKFYYCTKEGRQELLDNNTKLIQGLMTNRTNTNMQIQIAKHNSEELEFEK